MAASKTVRKQGKAKVVIKNCSYIRNASCSIIQMTKKAQTNNNSCVQLILYTSTWDDKEFNGMCRFLAQHSQMPKRICTAAHHLLLLHIIRRLGATANDTSAKFVSNLYNLNIHVVESNIPANANMSRLFIKNEYISFSTESSIK